MTTSQRPHYYRNAADAHAATRLVSAALIEAFGITDPVLAERLAQGEEFILDTSAGAMRGAVMPAWKVGTAHWATPWVHLRFDEPERAAKCADCNSWSGKWNFHFTAIGSEDWAATNELIHMQSRLVKGVEARNFRFTERFL